LQIDYRRMRVRSGKAGLDNRKDGIALVAATTSLSTVISYTYG
jgi:hypothetical protein